MDRLFVEPEPCGPREHGCTEGLVTDKRLLVRVSLQMGLKVPPCDEADATLLAFERLLTSVRPHMRLKVANLYKVLQAVTERADEVLWITLRPPDSLYFA